MRKKHLLYLGSGALKGISCLEHFRALLALDIKLTFVVSSRNFIPSDIESISHLIYKVIVSESRRRRLKMIEDVNSLFPFTNIVCFSEDYIEESAYLASMYNLPSNSMKCATYTTNKFEMREVMKQNHIPIPDYCAAHNIGQAKKFAAGIGYPVIIKPVKSYASKGVKLINDEKELNESFGWTMDISKESFSKGFILVEEFIHGNEYSAEVIVEKGQIRFCSFTEKHIVNSNFRDEIGHVHPHFFTQSIEERLREVIRNTVDAVRITMGGCHVEFKVNGDDIKIIEIASRLGGGAIPSIVKLSTGVDLFGLVFAVSLQQEPTICKSKNFYAAVSFITVSKAGKVKINAIPKNVYSVKGLLKVMLFHNEQVDVKLSKSGCERIGCFLARGKSKEELLKCIHEVDIILNNKILSYIK